MLASHKPEYRYAVGMSSTPAPTRRERVRLQTLDEIKQHAIQQVAAGGPSALSLNAIAKAMGMSGPAIYRYFASREQLLAAKRTRVRSLLGRGQTFSDGEADQILASPAGHRIEQMTRYAAVGTPHEVGRYVEAFAADADADELITVHPAPTAENRLRSIELLAAAAQPPPCSSRTR
jgi:AcrR family transcriptional regulator